MRPAKHFHIQDIKCRCIQQIESLQVLCEVLNARKVLRRIHLEAAALILEASGLESRIYIYIYIYI